MADALCGPSNPLQSFQKHTQLDRTLQQDRLSSSRSSPSQGFRTHDPRAGSLDAEFHAFENAVANPFQFEPRPGFEQLNNGPISSQPVSNWAADFQRLNISNQPIPSTQFRTEAPLIRSSLGGWQQDFMRQRQNASPAQKSHSPQSAFQQTSPPNQFYQGSSIGQNMFSHQPSYMPLQNLNQTEMQQGLDVQDMHLEKVFDDAFAQMDQEMLQHENIMQDDEIREKENFDVNQPIQQPSDAKVGSDAIQYTEVVDRSVDQDARDANELARVAGELIQNVSHETDAKFQNSQFLDLMRRIRDREIEVRNNDFENTAQSKQPEIAVATSIENQSILQPHDPNSFEFPNMNHVYQPNPNESADYSFDSDQYPAAPRTQMTDLHPGGPHYPERSPPSVAYAQMSGAINEQDRIKPNSNEYPYATA